ncbi:MAG: hypothetical protein AAF098_10180 [Pseudomonadota bacterium]
MKLPGFKRSSARTTLLGVCALAVLLWAAAGQLGINPNSLVAQLLVLLVALLLLITLAFAFGTLLAVVRRRLRGR